jgi:anti-sigma B factor antagonist
MASKPQNRRLESEELDDAMIVRFSAAILDEQDRALIEDEAFNRLTESGRKHLRLDLAEVRFVSSAALGALVSLHRKVKSAGAHLSLSNLNSDMREVIRSTKLDKLLDVRGA